jgi:membrane glycosyltransferase
MVPGLLLLLSSPLWNLFLAYSILSAHIGHTEVSNGYSFTI